MIAHIWPTIRKALRFTLCSLAILVGLASIIATGGGGGGGTGVSGGAGVGTVALSLGDGPADDYDHIWVYVTKVSLIPAPGNSAGHVVIYQSPTSAGHKIDLLAYREEDFFLGIKGDVPAGRYEKIRLEVARIESEGGPCELELIKLPSGKIDLNPRGGFEVRAGESLAIRLDVDANKSINLHPAGNSGKCIFRPVVFVDIKPGTVLQRCPVNVTGTITDLIDRDKDGLTDGFYLDLTYAHGLLTVWLDDDAPVFGPNGEPAAPDVLVKGAKVWARGRLNPEAKFLARAAVFGEVLAVDGVAQGAVAVSPAPDTFGTFPLLPNVGEALVVQTNVKLFEESLIFRGCDTPVGWDAIAQDVPARIFGKVSSDLLAAVVLLRQIEIAGEVIAFSNSSNPDGRSLTIRTSTGDRIVFVPKDTPIVLEGDGRVPLNLVCTGTRVRVFLDPDAIQPTATEVKVLPDLLEGTVTGISGGNTLSVRPDGQTPMDVYVRDDATIIDVRDDNYKLLSLAGIDVGDQVKVFGLKSSPCNSTFEAFVVLVVGP